MSDSPNDLAAAKERYRVAEQAENAERRALDEYAATNPLDTAGIAIRAEKVAALFKEKANALAALQEFSED